MKSWMQFLFGILQTCPQTILDAFGFEGTLKGRFISILFVLTYLSIWFVDVVEIMD